MVCGTVTTSTVYVTVHGTYFNRTLGLCGMWDGDPTNDLEPKADGVIHVGDKVSQFGWSWVSPKQGKTCQEKPNSAHPCDKTLFPDAAPLADAACDVLQKAPFTVCHHILDMETGMANCKHDVCSCHDSHCSCPVIKALI